MLSCSWASDPLSSRASRCRATDLSALAQPDKAVQKGDCRKCMEVFQCSTKTEARNIYNKNHNSDVALDQRTAAQHEREHIGGRPHEGEGMGAAEHAQE